MGESTLSRAAFTKVSQAATKGGTVQATFHAEERHRNGKGLDQLVDPKGYGAIRRSLPRFNKRGSRLVLTRGMSMLVECLLDTTGSMGNNVDIAFKVLVHIYDLLAGGSGAVLSRYDTQMINACFGDVNDVGTPILCRSQAEMDVKIAEQLTMLVPSRDGCGNDKEDPQYGLFGAAYLTDAAINRYGLKYYHFTVSDEHIAETLDLDWLCQIFGDDVLDKVTQNGHEMSKRRLPEAEQIIRDLQTRAHAFFLQVPGYSYERKVTEQWTRLYGADHVVMLPDGTNYLHFVQAAIIGLTEGVLSLQTVTKYLQEKEVNASTAKQILRAIAHIPVGAQAALPNFNKIPKAGDVFQQKTDLWPIDPNEPEQPESTSGNGMPSGTNPWL